MTADERHELDTEEAHADVSWARAPWADGAPPPAPVPPGRGGHQRIPRPPSATVGDPPPWASVPDRVHRATVGGVRHALAGLGEPRPSLREHLATRASAVLAPLYEADGETFVVLTRRTWDLPSHRGEVSLPGGRREPGEVLTDTALREAHEEIALDPASVEIIGELDHLATFSSDSYIVPFVGALTARPRLAPNPGEVDAVLHVPLAELLDPAVYREERWVFPDGAERPIFFFELVGDTLWGATAAMVRQLLGFATGTLGRGDLGHP